MVKGIFYTTEQIARELGISKQTLFRYEKRGIFPKARRNSINRWRQYTEEDLRKLKEIVRGSIIE